MHAIFWELWRNGKITEAEPPITSWKPPIQIIGSPTSVIPTIFMQHALPAATLPIYPGLGQEPRMLACIAGGLVCKQLEVDQ